MEFFGSGVSNLSMADRFTICNMAIEAGAKNGIFPVDDTTRDYMNDRSKHDPTEFAADDDAQYDDVIDVDLSSIPPTVALPHLPSNTQPASEVSDLAIDQCVIGSCTNGRIEDLRIAASILKDHHVSPNVRTIVIPATQ